MFNLEQRFKVVEDVVSVQDPWGVGITLQILKADSRKHVEWVKEQRSRSLIFAETSRLFTLRQIGASAIPEAITEGGDAGVLSEWQACWGAAMQSLVAQGKVTSVDIMRNGSADPIDDAVHRLVGFKGLLTGDRGVEVARTDASARKLLTSEVLVEDGYGEGMTLGEALRKFVFEVSAAHSVERQKYLEEAAKN